MEPPTQPHTFPARLQLPQPAAALGRLPARPPISIRCHHVPIDPNPSLPSSAATALPPSSPSYLLSLISLRRRSCESGGVLGGFLRYHLFPRGNHLKHCLLRVSPDSSSLSRCGGVGKAKGGDSYELWWFHFFVVLCFRVETKGGWILSSLIPGCRDLSFKKDFFYRVLFVAKASERKAFVPRSVSFRD